MMMLMMTMMTMMTIMIMIMILTLLSVLFIHTLMSDGALTLVSLLSDLSRSHDRTLWVAGSVEKRLQERLQV